MKNPQAFCLRAAGVQGFLAVAFGAFAAHALGRVLKGLPADELITRREWMSTGAHYQLAHAAALLALAALAPGRRLALVAHAFCWGSLLFSLSLYALALGAPTWAGAVTPLGGLLLLAGWALLLAAGGGTDPSGATAPQKRKKRAAI